MTEWILTSSVLILLVLAVRGLFKNRMKAKSVYALWLIVLVRLLCPVNFGELSFNLLSLAEEGKTQVEERLELKQEKAASSETVYFLSENGIIYPAMADTVTNTQQDKVPTIVFNNNSESIPEIKTENAKIANEPLALPDTPAFAFPEISWEQVLPVVWLVGMIGMAVVIVGVNISFGTTLGMFRKELPAMERKGRGKQNLSVYLADGITSSCLYGVVRPSIYLNRTGMGEQEKSYCVEHEYSHYLQGDMVWSLCRTLCLILHWYNPLVWVAVMLSKKDAELACDERTIERLGEDERYNYGHTLVELAAAQSKAVQMFGMATLMASDKKEVVERVKAITMKKETKIITGLLVAVLVVVIGIFVFTGEAKGEQENNNKSALVVTETPVPTAEAQTNTSPIPTMDPALAEFIEKSKEEHSRNELLTYILETNKFPAEGSVLATKLNVRSAAGYDADRIDILSAGTAVVINAVEQDLDGNYWYAVSYEQKDGKEIKNGYVNSAYLTEAGAVKETVTQIKVTPTPMPTWIVDKSTLTTDEKNPNWAEKVRIYKEKDSNSAYAEYYFGYDRLSAVRDIGDERWFMVETMDDVHGWVLYGEHEGVDIRIRSLLDASEESYEENRRKKALETELAFKEEITYQPLSFTDHTALDYKPGEGWSVDLNGDGKEELLYITGNRIFINETMQLSYKPERNLFFWLLDIDTTDGMYELLDENGSMFIFNGSYLCGVKGIQEHWFAAEETETEHKFLQYCGSLNNFTRLDEHTISFEDCFFMETSFFANAHYQLDENHGLQLIPQEYEVRLYNPTKGVNWYNYSKNWKKSFRVYKDRDLTGEFAEAANLTGAKLTKSDCVEWAYIEIENGLSGWLYFGEGSEMFFTVESSYEPYYTKIAVRLYKNPSKKSTYTDTLFDISMFQSSHWDHADSNWCYLELNTGEKGWFYSEQKNVSIIEWYKEQVELLESGCEPDHHTDHH